MELITTALSTALGKAVAGVAIAAASAGGLHAADVVELPVLPDQADEEVPVEDVPADAETVVANARENGGAEGEEDDGPDVQETEGGGGLATEGETDLGEGAGSDGKGVDGAAVSADAQDGGVDGMEVRQDAIEGTPAEGHAVDPQQASETGQERREAAPVPEQAGNDGDEELTEQAGDDGDEELTEQDEDADEGAPAPQGEERRTAAEQHRP